MTKDKSWDEVMELTREANLQMLRGDAEPLKRLYSHHDDVTLLGGFGGFERGWKEVGPRLEWAATQFSHGRLQQEVVSAIVGSDLAMIVTIERSTVRIGVAAKKSAGALRVTQVFRCETDGWKLVHRHGDPLVDKHAPEI